MAPNLSEGRRLVIVSSIPHPTSIDHLVFGGFCLSVHTRELISPGGVHSSLRRQSFEVLRHLLEEANTVVPHAVLMEKVWGKTVVGRDSLTQCIAEIRRQIGDSDRSVVVTLPRMGYRIVAEFGTPNSIEQLKRRRTHRIAALLMTTLVIFYSARIYWTEESASAIVSENDRPRTVDSLTIRDDKSIQSPFEGLLGDQHYSLFGFSGNNQRTSNPAADDFAEWRSGSIWAGVDPGTQQHKDSPFVVVRHHMKADSYVADWP